MLKRWGAVFVFVLLAFVIFIVSVFRSVQAKYIFTQSPSPSPAIGAEITIDYMMPYPGRIGPDSFLWPIKALRDKLWLTLNFKHEQKAAILLNNANKRIQMVQTLFDEDKPDLAVSTMTKAEKYLEGAMAEEKLARADKVDNNDFMQALALSTLKHRQILESVLITAPEDAKPAVVKALDYPKKLFQEIKNIITDAGHSTPNNPYDSQ